MPLKLGGISWKDSWESDMVMTMGLPVVQNTSSHHHGNTSSFCFEIRTLQVQGVEVLCASVQTFTFFVSWTLFNNTLEAQSPFFKCQVSLVNLPH